MSDIKLKRCPFCNEELELVGNGQYYAHKTNGCILQHLCFETDDVESIERWNTRKPMQEILERLEDYQMWKEHMIYDLTFREREIIKKSIEIVKEVGGTNG